MKKNFNRRSYHCHHSAKRRDELAQHARTLTWIAARIHSRTYVNMGTKREDKQKYIIILADI